MRDMSRMARLVIILLICTVASFLIAGIIFYSQYGGDFSVLGSKALRPENAVNIDEEKAYGVAGIDRIYVSTASDNVNIITTDSTELKARFHGYYASSSKDYAPEFTFEAFGGEINVKVEYPPISGPINVNSDLMVDIYLPAGYTKNLDIQTASACVKVDGINSLESFVCKTASGVIEAGTVNAGSAKLHTVSGSTKISGTYGSFEFSAASGSFNTDGINAGSASLDNFSGSIKLNGNIDDLVLHCVSGSINAAQLKLKSCRAENTSGLISLEGNPGKVDASTASGSIILKYDEYAGDITAKTVSGNVKIELPADAEFRVSHRTVSGGSNIDFPVAISGEAPRKGIEGVVVSGRNTINVTTASGSLEITK